MNRSRRPLSFVVSVALVAVLLVFPVAALGAVSPVSAAGPVQRLRWPEPVPTAGRGRVMHTLERHHARTSDAGDRTSQSTLSTARPNRIS